MWKRRQQSEPADPWDAPDPPLALAEQQLRWYARNRNLSRVRYQVSEVLILLTAAATTLAAALQARPWITASLAAGSLILTGATQGLRLARRLAAFSSAWAELLTAINDYRLLPRDRRDERAQQRLVARVNEVVSTETSRWASRAAA
jgi:hypothetical protein